MGRALLGWAGLALVVVALLHSCDPERHAAWKAKVDRIEQQEEIRAENARIACDSGVLRACDD